MSGPNERTRLREEKQCDLFDKLFKVNSSPGYFGRAVKRMTDAADKKTRDLLEARSEAFWAYTKANKAFNVRWQEVYRETRDEMILEANDE